MNRSIVVLVFAIASLATAASPCAAQTIAARWDSPSLLRPDQAADVFYRQAEGRAVTASELFEAEKYLRTDKPVSMAASVLEATFERLVQERLGASAASVRIRIEPVLQWLDSSFPSSDAVRLRGESLVLVVLNSDPNLAAPLLFHWTIHKEVRLCGSTPCFTPVSAPVRQAIAYELAIPLEAAAPAEAHSSELVLATGFQGRMNEQTYPAADDSRYLGPACDPLPSRTWFTPDGEVDVRMFFVHTAAATRHGRDNQVLCAFFAVPEDHPSSLTYSAGASLAVPPAGAASATVRNPLEFVIFQ